MLSMSTPRSRTISKTFARCVGLSPVSSRNSATMPDCTSVRIDWAFFRAGTFTGMPMWFIRIVNW